MVVRGVRDEFADHAIDVPVPENTLRHGIPNACNVCHADATPAAMAEALHARWPHAAARQARRLRLADAFDETTAPTSREPLRMVITDATEAPTLRGAAAQLLAQRFSADAASALLPLLTDPSIVLRAQAVEALGMANARDAGPALVPLLDDPALPVRHVTALVLASFGDRRGYVALRALADDEHTAGLFQPHLLLGMEAMHRNDLDAAVTSLERATALMPYHTGALVLLADAHARQGRATPARERLEQALSFDPNDTGARRRLAAMNAR
jgi:HEAT repeat protein